MFDPWSRRIPRIAKQLSPYVTATEPVLWCPGTATTEAHRLQLLKPVHPRARAPPTRETTTMRRLHTTTREQPLLAAIRKSLLQSNEDSAQSKKYINK